MGGDLTDVTRRALRSVPGSLPALARDAGVSPRTLARIRAGHVRASPAVARKVARALARWGTWCTRAAARLRAGERSRT